MKKLFVFLFAAMLSCGVYSQTTWNARAGYGGASHHYGEGYYVDFKENGSCAFGMLQCNIPIFSRVTVSPTLIGGLIDVDRFYGLFSFSALVGYRAKISNKTLFFPKVGPTITGEGFGVAVDLPFEIKHFVVGPTGYFADAYMIGLTVGYKF